MENSLRNIAQNLCKFREPSVNILCTATSHILGLSYQNSSHYNVYNTDFHQRYLDHRQLSVDPFQQKKQNCLKILSAFGLFGFSFSS